MKNLLPFMMLLAIGCSSTNNPPSTTVTSAPATSSIADPTGTATTAPPIVTSQQDATLNATNGAWSGDFGTITFKENGTVEMNIKDCGMSPDGSGPFGVATTCASRQVNGRGSLGTHTLNVDHVDGTRDQFAIYVDAEGRLHVASGLVTDIAADRSALIDHEATATQILVGASCQVSYAQGLPQPIGCHWAQRNGVDVVTVSVPDPKDLAKVADEVYVWDKRAHVLASPTAYIGVFTRST